MAARPNSFVVWGAGGHGRVVGDIILAAGETLAGYLDQDSNKLSQDIPSTGVGVIHLEDDFVQQIRMRGCYPDGIDACALGVGDNLTRQRCLEVIEGLRSPSLVHPTASVSPSSEIGRGSVVLALAVINTGARIGDGVIVNTGAIVEHDCVVGSAAHVSPGVVLCGEVCVGERTWIGAGSTVIPGVTIGRDVIIGAGSTVIRDVGDGCKVFGSPARGRERQR